MILAHGLGVQTKVHLMVWDTNPRTFNKPLRETKVNSKVELNQGDVLHIGNEDQSGRKRILTIDEVVEKKQSSLNGYNYYTLKTTRSVV